MVGIGIGIGLGLGSQRGAPAATQPSSDILCSAIRETRMISFRYRGASLTVEPYAVFKTDSATLLSAVVIRSDDVTLNQWGPQSFDVSAITEQQTLDTRFLPSSAFDASLLGDSDQIICTVNLV